jgi:hypothetical protein
VEPPRWLPTARQVAPLARLNEAGPVEQVFAAVAFQHGELGLTQSFAAAKALPQPGVERSHHFARDEIADRPQSHDQRFGSGEPQLTGSLPGRNAVGVKWSWAISSRSLNAESAGNVDSAVTVKRIMPGLAAIVRGIQNRSADLRLIAMAKLADQ